MVNQGKRVNIGSKEKPVFIEKAQLTKVNSTFWQGVVTGDVLIGGPDGIDLDKALAIGTSSRREKDVQGNRSR